MQKPIKCFAFQTDYSYTFLTYTRICDTCTATLSLDDQTKGQRKVFRQQVSNCVKDNDITVTVSSALNQRKTWPPPVFRLLYNERDYFLTVTQR